MSDATMCEVCERWSQWPIVCPDCRNESAPARPVMTSAKQEAAYEMIDRYLRNNLDDADYAEYSAALDRVASVVPAAPVVPVVSEDAALLDWYEANPHRVSLATNPGGDHSVWYALHSDFTIHACEDLRHAIRNAREFALTAALRPVEVDRG